MDKDISSGGDPERSIMVASDAAAEAEPQVECDMGTLRLGGCPTASSGWSDMVLAGES